MMMSTFRRSLFLLKTHTQWRQHPSRFLCKSSTQKMLEEVEGPYERIISTVALSSGAIGGVMGGYTAYTSYEYVSTYAESVAITVVGTSLGMLCGFIAIYGAPIVVPVGICVGVARYLKTQEKENDTQKDKYRAW